MKTLSTLHIVVSDLLLCFHANDFSISYVVGTDILLQKYKGNGLLHFHDKRFYTNAPQYYVIRTLPTLLCSSLGQVPLMRMLTTWSLVAIFD